MTNPTQPEAIALHNEQALHTLARAIRLSEGQFSLILVRCNYAVLRTQMIPKLRELCPFEIRELTLLNSTKTLYSAIKTAIAKEQPSALIVYGLDAVSDLDAVLTSTNQVRDQFRKDFPFPLVLWINDTILQKLIKLAPDFESWSTTIEFSLSSEALLDFVQQTTDAVFAKAAQAGARSFTNRASLHIETLAQSLAELEFALQELQEHHIPLKPDLEASLEFVLGQNASHSMETAKQHYERSLQLWKNPTPQALNSTPHPHHSDRQAILLFHMGLWWRQYAALHRAEYEQACRSAKDYFQQSINLFQHCNRPDLEARFINALGEVLQRLEQWEELEHVAQRSLTLHQTDASPHNGSLTPTEVEGDRLIRLAHDHGLFADVSLSTSNWNEAKQYAERALQLLAEARQSWHNETIQDQSQTYIWNYHQAFYRRSLSKALAALKQKSDAIDVLETARTEGNPQCDPMLYIQVLRELRELYFEQKDYLKAFRVRQAYRSIEQQYGFRAFVGAGRLQSQKLLANPALVTAEQSIVAQEIAASGRQQDVNRLIERIGRADCKLTVIYGQSGVGKSSILQAGLIPAVSPQVIDTRSVVVVLQQVYANWTAELGQRMIEALTGTGYVPVLAAADSAPGILEQLHKSVSQNLLTVVIFDQFEEFFFIYKDPPQRKPFYDFLKQCLNIPYVKVILSLREDYLHYLLECNRLENLEIINNNILDKNILFYLGNFSEQDAKAVIQSLTNRAQFFLEPDLVHALVQDLAKDLGEIRPIELQVVGAQLQTEAITTLETYRQKGPKEALVGRYLEEVIKDCGPENEQIAKLVLYLLTDENNTRPLKTRADLEMELEVTAEKLDLVLAILVESRLVFQIPSSPSDRYQLVHDYLVAFVRQQQSARLIAELEKEREQRKLTEAKLNQALRQQLNAARRATFTLAGLVMAIGSIAVIATLVGINSYLSTLSSSSKQNKELDRVNSALRAGKQLKRWVGVIPEVRMVTLSELNQAISGARAINRLEGHTDEITSISFSSDSKLIASASKDKTVRIWRIDGTPLPPLIGHTRGVTSVSFSPDSKKIVSASEDGTIKIWNIDGTLLATWQGHQARVNVVSFSPDGKTIASGSDDKTVRLWRNDGTPLAVLPGYEVGITELSFSPDGNKIASAGEYDVVRIWNLRNYKSVEVPDSYNTINTKFSADSQFVDVISRDGARKSYTLDGALFSGNSIYTGYFPVYLTHVSSSSDGRLIASTQKYQDRVILFGTGTYRDVRVSQDDDVTNLTLSPDGKFLVSATRNNKLTIWNLANEALDTQDDEPKNSIVRLSPDGKTVVVSRRDHDGTLALLRRDGTLLATIPGDSSVFSFSPDSQAIVAGSVENTVRIWNLNGSEIALPTAKARIMAVAVSPDGQQVITGHDDGSVQMWNSKGEHLKPLKGHTEPVRKIIFSPDSTVFASISGDKTVSLWQSDGTPIRTLPKQAEGITYLIFSPDSQTFVTLEYDSPARLWRQDGTLIKTLTGHPYPIQDAVFSPDGQFFATHSSSNSNGANFINLWRTDGTPLSPIEDAGINEIKFSSDSNTVAAIYYDGLVKFWNINGSQRSTLRRHSGQVRDISFSPNGKTIATASEDNTVILWDKEGHVLRPLRKHNSAVTGVAFSPDGNVLASVDSNNMVELWSAEGQELQTLQKANDTDKNSSDNKISFSSDGKLIIFIGSNQNRNSNLGKGNYTVIIWNRFGKELYRFRGQERRSYSYRFRGQNAIERGNVSSNGQIAALISRDSALKLWSLDGKLLKTLKGHTDWINSVSFSPNNRLIASASDDKTVKLWQRDGTFLRTLEGHEDRVNSVSFSHDSQTIASASDDKTVRLWNIDGQLLFQPIQHTDKVTSVLFSPTENTVASAISDGTITRWRASDGQQIGDKFQLSNDNPGGNSDDLDALSFSEDGNILALGTKHVNLHLTGWFLKDAGFEVLNSFPDGGFPSNKDAITVTGNNGAMVLTLGLDDLLARSCAWASDYLRKNPSVEERDRHLCDGVEDVK